MLLQGTGKSPWSRATRLLLPVAIVWMSGCSGGGDGGSETLSAVNDRYYFAGRSGVSIGAGQGVLSNDAQGLQSVTLASTAGMNPSSQLTLASGGGFSYRPGEGVTRDTFTYTAVSDGGEVRTASVELLSVGGGDVCQSLNVNTRQNLNISLLQHEPQTGDALVMQVSSSPARGVVSGISAGGVISYSHTGGSRGMDSLSVHINDAYGGEADVTVQVMLEPVRIMPLGDSITEGIESDSTKEPPGSEYDSPAMGVRVGYRKPLFDYLSDEALQFDLVGSRTTAGFELFDDFQHEGHPGYTDAELSGIADPDVDNPDFDSSVDGVYHWLTSNPADIVLLHAGTNNIRVRTSAVYNERLLDEIDRWESDNNAMVQVLVAKIIDKLRGANNHDNVIAYNADLESLVNARIVNGDHLVLVDMFSGVPSSLLDPLDQTHLTDEGYQKMAEIWYQSLYDSGTLSSCN